MKAFAICCLVGTIIMIVMHIAQDLSYIPVFTDEDCERIRIEEGIE